MVIKTVIRICQSVLKQSYDYEDFSTTGDEWRVIKT